MLYRLCFPAFILLAACGATKSPSSPSTTGDPGASGPDNGTGPTGPSGPTGPTLQTETTPPVVVIEQPLASLTGEATAAASSALPKLGPIQAAASNIDAEGVVLTRLEAVLQPTATVAEVNQALASTNTKLSNTRPDMAWVTLFIDAVADFDAAETKAAALRATGVFVSVSPAFITETDVQPLGAALAGNPYLAKQRFLPAWNAASLATKMPVRCADAFRTTNQPTQLAHLKFRDPTPPDERTNPDGTFPGNHGYWTMSILGALADTIAPTGTSPDPEALLDLLCTQSGGFTMRDMMTRFVETFPATGNFVVSTSLGYKRTRTERVSRAEVASDALFWRHLLKDVDGRFIHASSSGNAAKLPGHPSSQYSAPFHTQALFADLFTVIPEAERPSYQAFFDAQLALDPGLLQKRGSLLIVGSSNNDGDLSDFSQGPANVRMMGEFIGGLCVATDAICGADGFMFANGTSAAAPQVAGLAAYMWGMKPTLPVATLRSILIDAFDDHWVDAYTAVLALEREDISILVRDAILDVTNASGGSADGVFDQHDVEAFLTALDTNLASQPDAASAIEDYSRFDLNGDGFTREDTAVEMDLNLQLPNGGAFYLDGGTSKRLDESAITDLDALCFYAWSGRYQGDTDARIALLTGRCRNVAGIVIQTLEGTLTLATNDSYAFSTVIGGSNGRYPHTESGTNTYNVTCSFQQVNDGKAPKDCRIVSASGSGSGATVTTEPAWRERGIGTSCHTREDAYLTESEAGTGAIIDTFDQQYFKFVINDSSQPSQFDLHVNLFGINTLVNSTERRVNVVLAGTCEGSDVSETFDGGQRSVGRLNTIASNVGNLVPGTSFSGSHTFNGAFPATSIDEPGRVREMTVSWSLQVIETQH